MSPLEALGGLAIDRYDGGSAQFEISLARLFPKLGAHIQRARRVPDIRQVAPKDVQAWVDAPLADGSPPSLATRHNRRSAARLGFRLLREAGVVDHDPTVDIHLPARRRDREARPLSDDEIRRGRAASVGRLGETLRPAVWALAEATATTHEIPRVLPQHLDLSAGTVLLGGSSKLESRQAVLTDWGVRALDRRMTALGDTTQSVAYQGTGCTAAAMQAAAATALTKILGQAGLRSDPSVKPGSVRAWAGRRVFLATGRIEEVALVLGCRTLDTAAAIIGFDWSELR